MKAAVFREVNVPMQIEEISVAKPGPRAVSYTHLTLPTILRV